MDRLTRWHSFRRPGERAAAERFAQQVDGAPQDGPSMQASTGELELVQLLRRRPAEAGPADLDAGPSPEFRSALRTRLLAVAAVQGVGERAPGEAASAAVEPRRPRHTSSRGLAVVAGALASVVAVSGVAAASTQSLPGDPFYGVKRTAEAVSLLAAGGRVETGERHLELARTRLDELRQVVVGRGAGATPTGGPTTPSAGTDPDRQRTVDETLDAMDDQVRSGEELLVAAHRDSGQAGPLMRLRDFSDRQRSQLDRLLPFLPLSSRDRASGSLALVTSVGTDAQQLLDLGSCTSACQPAPSGPGAAVDVDCDCPDTPAGPPSGVPSGAPSAPTSTPSPAGPPAPATPAPAPGQPGSEPSTSPSAPAPQAPSGPVAPAPPGGPTIPVPPVRPVPTPSPPLPLPPPLPSAPSLPLPPPLPSAPSLPLPLPSAPSGPGTDLPVEVPTMSPAPTPGRLPSLAPLPPLRLP